MKTCSKCKTEKPLSEFGALSTSKDGHKGQCKVCIKSVWEAWYANPENREKNRARNRGYSQTEKGKANSHRKRLARYGLTAQEFEDLTRASNGLCDSCKTRVGTSIDHDHKTGKVRGFLCSQCNTALGLLGDNSDMIQRLLMYSQQA